MRLRRIPAGRQHRWTTLAPAGKGYPAAASVHRLMSTRRPGKPGERTSPFRGRNAARLDSPPRLTRDKHYPFVRGMSYGLPGLRALNTIFLHAFPLD